MTSSHLNSPSSWQQPIERHQ